MSSKRILSIFCFSLFFIIGGIFINSLMPYPLLETANIGNISKIISIETAALPYLFASLIFCLFFSCSIAFMIYGNIKEGIYYGGFLWFAVNIILSFFEISTFKLILAFRPENYFTVISYLFFLSFTLYLVNLFFAALRYLNQKKSCLPVPPDILFLFLPASFLYIYSFIYSLKTANYFNFITEIIILLVVSLFYCFKERLAENKYFYSIKKFTLNKFLPIAINEYSFLIFILILAFIPRWIASYGITIGTEDNLGGPDSNNYHPQTLAVIGNLSNILSPLLWEKPGINVFLIPIYSFFGPNPTIARYFLIAMGVVSCALTYFIGKKIFSKKVGVLAAYFHAGYNYLIYSETWIGTEGITIFLIEIFVLIILKIQEGKFNNKREYLSMYIAGLSFGYAIFTRPEFLFFPLFFLVWLYFYKKDNMFIAFIIFLLGIFSILTPWIIRNYIAYGSFYIFYLPAFAGGGIPNEFKSIGIDTNNFFKSIINMIIHFPQFIHAIIFSEKMHSNIVKFLYWNQFHPYNPSDFIFFRFGTLYYFLGHFFLSMFTIVGFVVCLKSFSQKGAIIIFLIIYKIVITYFTTYKHWYRATVEPYLLLLAALGIIFYFRKVFVLKERF